MADQLEAAEAPQTVADALILTPKTSGPEATVRDMKAQFENDRRRMRHRHHATAEIHGS